MSDLIPLDVVQDVEFHANQPMVSSLRVAQRFGRHHKDVLDTIRSLLCNLQQSQAERNFPPSDFVSNFVLGNYLDPTGRSLPMYFMTRDGFSLLAMRFTGAEALRWQVQYIEAFNRIETALKESLTHRLERAEAERQALEATHRERLAGLLALPDERRQLLLRVVRYAKMGLARWEIKRLTGLHKDTIRKLLRQAEALGLADALPEAMA